MTTQEQMDAAKAVINMLSERKITGYDAVSVLATAKAAEESRQAAQVQVLALSKVLRGGK